MCFIIKAEIYIDFILVFLTKKVIKVYNNISTFNPV